MISNPYYDFFVLEKERKLFELEYCNVKYWQLVRMQLLKGITINKSHVVNNFQNRSIIKEIVGAFYQSIVMKKKIDSLEKVDLIRIRPVVTLDGNHNLGDHQYDYYELESDISVLDLYALGNYVAMPDVVDINMSMAELKVIIWKIRRKIFGAKKIENSQKIVLQSFLQKINEIYSTDFEIKWLEGAIQYAVETHLKYINLYSVIFKKTQPKAILVYPHYDEHMYAAMAVAKRMEIKTIEMQHGRINAHEAYWYEDHNPIGKTLPDYFLTYGDWWNNQISLPEFCKVVSVGNAYLEKQVKTYQREKKDHLVVSVFSNPQNGKTLLEFINSIQEYCVENNIEILYKLHPNESKVWKTEYPMLLKLRNTTIYDSGSVYSVLSQSDVVIGINSTVFFEALAYEDLHIYIYTIGDYEGMKPLLENNMATAVRTPEEFIANLSRIGSGDISTTLGDSLWKSNANENINIALQSIFESCKY